MVGEHALEVIGAEGRERISSLFEWSIEVALAAGETLPEEIGVGADASLRFEIGDDELRVVHGMLETVTRRIDAAANRPVFKLTLVPRAARARLVQTQQIFMDMSVVDIVANKLQLVGLEQSAERNGSSHLVCSDVSLSQLGSYPQREFVVQYGETDLAFMQRLCENLGISYYFEHGAGVDQIVFTDNSAGFGASHQPSHIELSETLQDWQKVYELDVTTSMAPANYVVCDYNYRRPELQLQGQAEIASGHGGAVIEYGSHTKTDIEAGALAKLRAEEIQCRQTVWRGAGSIPGMCAGGTTTLNALDGEEIPLLVVEVHHVIELQAGAEQRLQYRNTFVAYDPAVPFRPERTTPTPRIHGVVTGVVQGVPGTTGQQSALLDSDGRYTIEFHFDSVLGDPTMRASRPVRMTQPFGGTGHGMHFPLRPGVEVAVAFADGDPDRPIIVGAIPNAHTRTPVTSVNSTQNRITTASGAIFEISERR